MSGGGLLCGFFSIAEGVSQPGPSPAVAHLLGEHASPPVSPSSPAPEVLNDPKLAAREQELHEEVQKLHPPTLGRRDELTINTACIHEYRAARGAQRNAERSGFAAAARLEPAFSMPHTTGIGGARNSLGFQRMSSTSVQQGELQACMQVPSQLPMYALSHPSLQTTPSSPVRSVVGQGPNGGRNNGLAWTGSRQVLEDLINAEQQIQRQGHKDSALSLTDDQRLMERLDCLNLEMVPMAGDGNCQVRGNSQEGGGSSCSGCL
jgi:hypothetical protein